MSACPRSESEIDTIPAPPNFDAIDDPVSRERLVADRDAADRAFVARCRAELEAEHRP